MSVSPDFQARRAAAEKSNFSQTCNLLSQYLKGKGNSFGDLNLGINTSEQPSIGNSSDMFRHATSVTTRNLLPQIDMSDDVSAPIRKVNSMDLFPRHASFTTPAPAPAPAPVPVPDDVVSRKITSSDLSPAMEPETAQMTIFYAGQVLVFDKFPAEKAKELILLATKSCSVPPTSFTSTSTSTSGNDLKNSSGFMPSGGSNFISPPTHNPTQERAPCPPRAHVSDLPIARKASLHRFLEKRKDRLSAKAPYQLNMATSTQSKPVETKKSWLGLSSESTNTFDLQL